MNGFCISGVCRHRIDFCVFQCLFWCFIWFLAAFEEVSLVSLCLIGVGKMWLCGLVDVHSEVINDNSQVLFMVVRFKRGLNDSLETYDIDFCIFMFILVSYLSFAVFYARLGSLCLIDVGRMCLCSFFDAQS